MKVLTDEDVRRSFDWSKNLGEDYVKYEDGVLRYTHPEAAQIVVAFPKDVEKLPYFVRDLAALCYDEQNFEGALAWVTLSGIGTEFYESIGYQILESINTAAGQPHSFVAASGYDLRPDQFVKTLGILMMPIIFGWDAYYLPRWSVDCCSDYFLQIHHHSVVRIDTKTRKFHDRAIKYLIENKFEILSSQGEVSRYLSKSDLDALISSGHDTGAKA